MKVTFRSLLPALGMSAVVVGTVLSNIAPVFAEDFPGGYYQVPKLIGPNDTLTVQPDDTVYIGPGGTVEVNGGTLEILGAVELLKGGRLTVTGTGKLIGQKANEPLTGMSGAIIVHPGATATFTGEGDKTIDDLVIDNAGFLDWGGKGNIKCGPSVQIKNDGTMQVSNGEWQIDSSIDVFLNRGLIFVNKGDKGTVPGNLDNRGEIHVGVLGKGGVEGKSPQPTVMLISGNGNVGQPGSLFTSTMTSSSYGQLSSTGTININGGTMKYVLSPTTYVPSNAYNHDVLKAITIGGTGLFDYFIPSGAAFRFDKTLQQTASPHYYRLYSYN